ncbi:MAG: O-antigen ligase family protein [Endomicrobia bacterium]|nr:O-antigen ligase family protein [Endomicrobiia bacterium]
MEKTKKIIEYSMIFFIFVFALFVSYSISAIAITTTFLFVGFLLLCFLNKKFLGFNEYNEIFSSLIFFLISLILSTIFSSDLGSSIKRSVTIFGYFVVLVSTISLENKKTIKYSLYLLFIGVFLHGIYCVVQYFTGLDLLNKGYTKFQRVVGLVGHFNSVAAVMGLIFPTTFCLFYFLKDRKSKFFYSIISLVVLLCIVFTFTRGIWIGIFLFFVILGIFLDKKILNFAILLVCVLFIFSSTRERILSTIYRKEIVRNEFLKLVPPLMTKRFILGWGPDSFRNVFYKKYPDFLEKGHFHPHNMYLHILFELGIIGFLSFCHMFFNIFKKIFLNYLKTSGFTKYLNLGVLSSGLIFLVYGLVDEPFRAHFAPYVFFFLIGISYQLSMIDWQK